MDVKKKPSNLTVYGGDRLAAPGLARKAEICYSLSIT